jgi:GNAT superfamily N-acetyltransferase
MSRDTSAISIEALRHQDLPAALNIQREAYPPFLVEDEAAFLSRINLAASYCFAAKREGALLGYLLAHGWKRQSPPALGALLADGVPSEVLFIHDLAVSPASRGLGVGQKLIARAFQLAAQDGLRSAELIAVEGAANYWRQFGFVEAAVSEALSEKLGTYGSLARWMTREITPDR